MKVLSVLAGRPHLVKAESVHVAFDGAERKAAEHITIECWHGRHNDYPNRSDEDFELPEPAAVIRDPERAVVNAKLKAAVNAVSPDVMLVYGDLPLGLAATTAGLQLNIPIVHVESGYRSRDAGDREEATRILLDHLAALRIVHSGAMADNLRAEGIDPSAIAEYGNCAVQTLNRRLPRLLDESVLYGGVSRRGLVTFHRDENFRRRESASRIVQRIVALAKKFEIHFVVYGWTRQLLTRYDLIDTLHRNGVQLMETLPYERYVRELLEAAFIVTDSSGLQDECAFLQKPCFVLRRATPRLERLGKFIHLSPIGDTGPDDLVASVDDAVSTELGRGPDLSLLGRPYDDSFLRLLASLA